MLHRYDPNLTDKLKSAVNKIKKSPEKIEFLKKKDKGFLNNQAHLTKLLREKNFSRYYRWKNFSLIRSLSSAKFEFKEYISKKEAAQRAFEIREKADKEKWHNAELLRKLTDLEVINYETFSIERRKDPSFLNKIFNAMKLFVDYSFEVIKSLFKSKEEILPSNESVLLPNLDLYTQGLGTNSEEYTDEIKLNILVGYQIWFRMQNLIESKVIEKVFDKYLNTDCKKFGRLPLFDLSAIVPENICLDKFKFKSNAEEENETIIKIISVLFEKLSKFIQQMHRIYYNCINPLHTQVSDIILQSIKLSKSEFSKEIKSVLSEVKTALFKNSSKDYEENSKNYRDGGFGKDPAKLLALIDEINNTFEEMKKNPDLKTEIEKIENEVNIIILGSEKISPVNINNLDEVKQYVTELKNEKTQIVNNSDKASSSIEQPLYNKNPTAIQPNLIENNENNEYLKQFDEEIEYEKRNIVITSLISEIKDNEKSDSINKINSEINTSLLEVKEIKDFENIQIPIIQNLDSNLTDSKSEDSKTGLNDDDFTDQVADGFLSGDEQVVLTGRVYSKIKDKYPKECKRLEKVLIKTATSDVKEAYNNASILYNHSMELLKKENITPIEKIKLMNDIKNDASLLLGSTANLVTTVTNPMQTMIRKSKELNHEVNLEFKEEFIEFVKNKETPILGKVAVSGSMGYEIYQTEFAADVQNLTAMINRYNKTGVLGKPTKLEEIIKNKTKNTNFNDYKHVQYFKTAKEAKNVIKIGTTSLNILQKLDTLKDDDRVQAIKVGLFDNLSNDRLNSNDGAQTKAVRFKELVVNAKKNKIKEENKLQSKTYFFSKDPEKEANAKKQTNDALAKFFKVKELTESIKIFFNKISMFKHKLKQLEIRYYEKISKYFEAARNISLVFNSINLIFPSKTNQLSKEVENQFSGNKCDWLKILAQQIVSVPVLRFISHAWEIYKNAKIVYKIYELIVSAKESKLPDSMFYYGQLISELINLGFSLKNYNSCEKPAIKSKKFLYNNKKLRLIKSIKK